MKIVGIHRAERKRAPMVELRDGLRAGLEPIGAGVRCSGLRGGRVGIGDPIRVLSNTGI